MNKIENSKRKDLVKYLADTKTISWRVRKDLKIKGTAARDLLLKVFVNFLTNEENNDEDLDLCGKILAFDLIEERKNYELVGTSKEK